MAFAGLFLDGEGAFFGGSGAQGAGGGAARRAQPAAAGFACAFALRAKGGSAVVGAGRGLPRRAGRPAGRAAKPHDAPRRRRGAGSAPEGRSACRPCACGKGAFGVGAMPAPFGAFARGGSREAREPRPRR